LGLVAVVALGSAFSALVGSETFMLARVSGLVGWMYVLFHFTLSAQQLAIAEIPPATAGPPATKAAPA
jgi:succinate dehydrogenase hydrophobic anchor subunit